MYAPAPQRTSILDFIKTSSGSQFVIPVYQRNYTWSANDKVDTYLKDIERLIKGDADAHFFGIVIYRDIPLSHNHHEFQVVDGQQRITTLFLTLYALKHLALEGTNAAKDFANELDDTYLINKYIQDDSLKLKLKPLISDDNVYIKIVNNSSKKITDEDKNSNVYKNYKYILNKLRFWIDGGYDIDSIMEALSKLYIVTIPVWETDDPQQIFESLNSDAEPLTAADLIRNYLLMNENDQAQTYFFEKYWKQIENKLPISKDQEDFFRMFLANQIYELPRKKDVYNTFKKWCHKEQETRTKQEVYDKICAYLDYYFDIYHNEQTAKTFPILQFFRMAGSIMPAPLLMEIFRLYDDSNISKDVLINAISIIDSYMIRRSLVSRDTSEITRFFPGLLRKVICATGENYETLLENLKFYLVNETKFTGMRMPTDEDIRTFLSDNDAYVLKCTRTVLNRLELNNNHAKVDLSNLTVEHLCPQTPTDYWYKQVPKEIYDKYVGLIGNLTLSTSLDNSAMGNNEWEGKKNILKKTNHINLNAELLKYPEWNKIAIEKRTAAMIDQILAIYPYTNSSLTEPPFLEARPERTQIYAKKAKRFDFDMLNIPNGSILEFIKNGNEKCCVVSSRSVEYNGKEYSLSALALELLNKYGIKWPRVQGPSMFKYKEEVLTERRKRLESKSVTA